MKGFVVPSHIALLDGLRICFFFSLFTWLVGSFVSCWYPFILWWNHSLSSLIVFRLTCYDAPSSAEIIVSNKIHCAIVPKYMDLSPAGFKEISEHRLHLIR